MTNRTNILAAAALALAMPGLANAEDIKGKWSVAIQAGTDLELSGNVHESGSGLVLALPTVVESRSYSDVYDPSFRGQLSIGYGIGERTEVFLRGSYYKMSSETLQVGTVAGLRLDADFADYDESGLELGLRHHFRMESRFRPYVALAAGARMISELPSTFSVPAADVVLSDVPFYDKSTVFVMGADLGFAYKLSEAVSIGLETGPRYQSGLSDLEGLAGSGLEPINDTGSRWSMPVLASLSFRF